MSVNIFGATSKFSSGVNNSYIDQKFKTLSTNLASKVNKLGDSMTGDLNILLNDDKLRTFGVSDLTTGQSMSLLLGNVDNQLRHNFGHPLKLTGAFGTKLSCSGGDVCRMGAQNDARARFLKDVVMSNNYITGLHDPEGPQDAATKNYVDIKCIKNCVGYIPNMISNNLNKTGFIISANSEVELNEACNVFSIIGEWLSAVNTDFWIQVRCPERVRIHKFAVKGTKTSTIRVWKLQATNDEITWDDIFDNALDGNSAVIDEGHSFHESESLIKYQTYRIFVINAIGENPGLSYWQLYTVDTLV
jgi:hypothetical protein